MAAIAAAAALAASILVLRLWRMDPRTPLEYSGDANYMLMSVRAILEGSVFVNDRLGAPLGQDLYDFPFLNGDALNVAAIAVLGQIWPDPAFLLNLFYVLTFPVVAVIAFFVLRALGISRGPSFVCGVLYALLPYHFLRGEAHLFLSAYYAVPLGALLVMRILGDERLFGGRRTLATVVMCVVVGTAGVYYAAFTLVLVVAATALAFAVRRTRAALAAGAAVAGLIALTVFGLFSPTLLYRATNGGNAEVEREPWEAEVYSLPPIELVLPVAGHRLGPLADLKEEYASTVRSTEASAATLGVVATVGLVWLLVVLLASAFGGSRPGARRLDRNAAIAVAVALLAAATGGLGTVFAFLVTPWLHAWNRMSVVIAFFALLAVAVLLDRLRAVLARRRVHALVWPAVLASVLGVGVFDQTTDAFVRPYDEIAVEYRRDSAFVRDIEAALPAGAMVFQLPAVAFPESGHVGGATPYDAARPYVHSDNVRWSYGAMRGRPADWASETRTFPARLLVRALSSVGFSGVVVDARSYPDAEAARVERDLFGALGEVPLVSAGRRFLFFDLRPFADQLRQRHSAASLRALRESILNPVRFEWSEEYLAVERAGAQKWRWARSQVSRVKLVNPLERERTVELRATVATATVTPANVWVRYPDGAVQHLIVTGAGVSLERSLRLAPGDNVVEFATDAPQAPGDPRTLYLRLIDAGLVDPARTPFYPEPVDVM